MSKRAPRVRAAGGLVWRDAAGGPEIALVHRPRYDDWSLPKGKLDPGEHPLLGACREVVEETGLRPLVGPRLPTLRYRVDTAYGTADKTVDFWAMQADGGEFAPSAEVDGIRWVPLVRATGELSYGLGDEVVAAFAALPRISATVLLVRHAKAGKPAEWSGSDASRPLEPAGLVQAGRLAELLPLFGPTRTLTATPLRCAQTVRPVADRLGLELVTDGVFDEREHWYHPGRAVERIRGLAADRGRTLVCSQGGIIPDVVAELAGTDGCPVTDVRTPKGHGWVLSFTGRRLVAADPFAPDTRPG